MTEIREVDFKIPSISNVKHGIKIYNSDLNVTKYIDFDTLSIHSELVTKVIKQYQTFNLRKDS